MIAEISPARTAVSLSSLLCLDDVEDAATHAMAADLRDFVAGGAGTETTLRANRTALERVRLVPRVLNDVSACSTETTVLGTSTTMPVLVAPMAYQRLAHPEGERALAAACAGAGVIYVASMLSSSTFVDITATGASTWCQLYWLRDRGQMTNLLRRAESAGCRAVVLTVDVPRMGRRLRDIRSGFTLPAGISAVNLSGDVGVHDGSDSESAFMAHTRLTFDPSLSWSDLDWLRQRTSLPIVVKGVLHPDDAQRAAELGVDALIVSNHGGRQLDGAVSSAEALPAVREVVGDRCEVLMDSGIRSGSDVVKAIALGASSVLIGRPAWWGLALAGQAGAARVLELIRQETEDAVALAGCRGIADVRSSVRALPAAESWSW
ncbi:alpha-hydroxy acid oxidase [Lentzea rhizosphaerae]|uniref:Alpha-hydroxy acid oxidase n=1 Tax=Lentzea rhizosphaerae TaxID=2041025 RepID=A0ABV8BLY3_9PSEU